MRRGVMLGLALEGGGAKGAFHMGAVKAFLEEGYHFDGITGTSIGAINGAIIAQGDFEKGYNVWKNMDNSLIYEMEDMQQKIERKKIDIEALSQLTAKIKNIIESRTIDKTKARKMLESIIDENKLRNSNADFGLVTVSLSDLKPLELYKEDIPQGKLIDYLLASASFPGLKIEPIDGKFYIDGGLYDNLPVNLLIRKGYKEIIAVRTFAIGKIRKAEDHNVKIINVTPSDDLGAILNFDHEMIEINLKMGYFDAMRKIKCLKGVKYYIEPSDKELIFKGLLNIPEKTIESLGKTMEIHQPFEPKRMLFEKILPDIARMFNLPKTWTYEDIVIAIMEYEAQEMCIDRFSIRSLKGFLEELKSKGSADCNHHDSTIANLLKKLPMPVRSKKTVLKEICQEFLSALRPECFSNNN
jgi:NTE family protein